MSPRYLRLVIALLVVMSFCTLVIGPSIQNVTATAPTITAYGISPANAGIGTLIRTWLTYTDADNDAPTYVRCTRTLPTGFAQLQTPNTMVANNSGDTTYTDGKQYYYDWYYFPFVGTGLIKFMVKSGADAEVTKTVVEFQEPAPALTHSGVAPVSDSAGSYTFFTNYSSAFNTPPSYVRINVNGTDYAMAKNDSGDSSYVDGVNYSYSVTLPVGNHTYSFHARTTYQFAPDQSSGIFWLMVKSSLYLPISILSSPGQNASLNETYVYQPVVCNPGNYSLNWTLTTNATGLSVDPLNGTIVGAIGHAGLYFVNLSVFDGTTLVWQNYTLGTAPSWVVTISNLTLALLIGFGLIAMSYFDKDRRRTWSIFAGFVWIVLGVVIFYSFGSNLAEHVLWMTIAIGIGLILMLEGALHTAAGRKT